MREYKAYAFKFSELSPKAKEQAKREYAEAEPYAWAEDALKSLRALADHFGGKLRDYSIDWSGMSSPSNASFDMPEMLKAEIKTRLAQLGDYNRKTQRGNGDCKLTGYCADEDAIDGFRFAFHKGETDLVKLMQAAFKTWLKAAQDDYNAFFEDKEFSDFADANEYEFDEHGKILPIHLGAK